MRSDSENAHQIKLTMPNGPAMMGSCIEVDGVEQRGIRSIAFSGEAGDIGRLTLVHFASMEIEGFAEVERVHVCPECKSRLERCGASGAADASNVGDEWRRVIAVGPTEETLLAAARIALDENVKMRKALLAVGVNLALVGVAG